MGSQECFMNVPEECFRRFSVGSASLKKLQT